MADRAVREAELLRSAKQPPPAPIRPLLPLARFVYASILRALYIALIACASLYNVARDALSAATCPPTTDAYVKSEVAAVFEGSSRSVPRTVAIAWAGNADDAGIPETRRARKQFQLCREVARLCSWCLSSGVTELVVLGCGLDASGVADALAKEYIDGDYFSGDEVAVKVGPSEGLNAVTMECIERPGDRDQQGAASTSAPGDFDGGSEDEDSGVGSVRGDEIPLEDDAKHSTRVYSSFVRTRRVTVRFGTRASHGKDQVAALGRRLAQARRAASESDADLTIDRVHELLQDGIPEPEFMLIFGDKYLPLSPHGYMPWQTRLTEYWRLGGDDRIRYQDFLWGLHKFSQKSHRFGK
ncbi:hypothetical protein DFJ73DRAFT_849220 [Zopfochytrium polystomum]|nr:hypothetical protein DFJ73DRAFT_849220 [Zopfochytrium polystomum]